MISLTQQDVSAYYAARVPNLPQRGKRWRGPCPIHGGKNDSFSVDPQSGLWRCWSACGRGGDVIELEMALSNSAWREAVLELERITGRTLLDRPGTKAERHALAQHRQREQQEMRDAEFWRIAAESTAELVLEDLPEAVPERFGPTQFLRSVRSARGATLLALYRDFRREKSQLAAAMVYAGERSWQRQCDALARFIMAGAEVSGAA